MLFVIRFINRIVRPDDIRLVQQEDRMWVGCWVLVLGLGSWVLGFLRWNFLFWGKKIVYGLASKGSVQRAFRVSRGHKMNNPFVKNSLFKLGM